MTFELCEQADPISKILWNSSGIECSQIATALDERVDGRHNLLLTRWFYFKGYFNLAYMKTIIKFNRFRADHVSRKKYNTTMDGGYNVLRGLRLWFLHSCKNKHMYTYIYRRQYLKLKKKLWFWCDVLCKYGKNLMMEKTLLCCFLPKPFVCVCKCQSALVLLFSFITGQEKTWRYMVWTTSRDLTINRKIQCC